MSVTRKTMHPFDVPKELYLIQGWKFATKLLIAASISSFCIIVIARFHPLVALPAQVVLGAMFAHFLELAHQALHMTGFRSKFLNRFFGVLLCLPMFVSFTHYQVMHRQHHAWTGTERDSEFFNYDRDNLKSQLSLIRRACSFVRYKTVLVRLWATLLNGPIQGIENARDEAVIRKEYRLMIVSITTITSLSLIFHSWMVVQIWAIPLLFAEPIHYLVELPEHFDCDHDTHYMLDNTRTIRGGWFSFWFTNGNNFHVEHHYAPNVPIDRLPDVHRVLVPNHKHYASSYRDFYRKLVKCHRENTHKRDDSPA